ncbi:UNVERIFIED_CONTAM: hypothetical protein HDU68_002946 [Siphonaria sp. JEL0065]|nr:hypothetical protein HDU68_002946 [Siphonaria sp. JEL0065]
MKSTNKDILAVQSLRNLIMASSILASTCVAVIFGFIAFLATLVSHPESVDSNGNPLGSQFGFALDALFGPKVMLLLVVFCVAFFCFAQSMRFYNHVGMVININLHGDELEEAMNPSPRILETTPDSDKELSPSENPFNQQSDSGSIRLGLDNEMASRENTLNRHAKAILRNQSSESVLSLRRHSRPKSIPRLQEDRERRKKVHALASRIEFVARMLNRGSMFYTLGMRGYYISFPIMAFLWGPWALLGTTVLLVAILRVVDFNLEALNPAMSEPDDVLKMKEQNSISALNVAAVATLSSITVSK